MDIPLYSQVFVAGYLKNKLVAVHIHNNPDDKIITEFDTEIDTVKIMVWDSMENLMPEADAEVISENEWVIEKNNI